MFYSNRTVINNLIKFRLIFIQTKRVSYTQRHSHESLPPRPRSEYKEKKLNLYFFYTLPPRRISFNPISRPGSFCDGRVTAFFLSRFASFFFTHIHKHTHTHTLLSAFPFLLVFVSPHLKRIRTRFISHRSLLFLQLAQFLSNAHTHIHTHAYLCRLL